jgi:hypothetical protein
VPDLDQILDLAPEGFEVVKTDDQGVSVSKFDDTADQTAVVSERTWMVTFKAKEGQVPHAFHFGSPKVDVTEAAYQRYNDADLVTVGDEVDLEHRYGRRSLAWVWWAVGGGIAVVGLGVFAVIKLRKPKKTTGSALQLPAKLTPFTVLGLLKRIQANNTLSAEQHTELDASIRTLERHYFATDGNGQVDLHEVAEGWVRKVQ